MKLHSVVDPITNSSSTVYIWPTWTGVEDLKKAFQNIMDIFGVEGSVDDYLTIEKCLKDEYLYEYFFSNYASEYPKHRQIWKNFLQATEQTDTPESRASFTEMINDMYKDGDFEVITGCNQDMDKEHLYADIKITSKDGQKLDILDKLFSAFNIEEREYY